MTGYRAAALDGRWIGLEPLAPAHEAELRRASAEPRIWTYMGTDVAARFDDWFRAAESAAAEGREAHFVVRLRTDDSLAGSSRYLNLTPAHKRLEIGHTWYRPAHWGGPVNPECKLLLLRHAFGTLGVNRVEFRCDARNQRSRAALHRLGAIEEGTLRRHMIVRDGFVRDSMQFAITDLDWPRVEAALEARLATLAESAKGAGDGA
jgi:RimJ/RimL family protein N-acetyltransferase